MHVFNIFINAVNICNGVECELFFYSEFVYSMFLDLALPSVIPHQNWILIFEVFIQMKPVSVV